MLGRAHAPRWHTLAPKPIVFGIGLAVVPVLAIFVSHPTAQGRSSPPGTRPECAEGAPQRLTTMRTGLV
jgi:hypothetical protein